jgi:glycosyltransferase involved in cell wall biosynthesis
VAFLALDFRKITEKRFWGTRRYVRDGIAVFELSLPTGIYRRGLPILQALCNSMYQKVVHHWGRPDVLHTHFYFMGAIAAKLPKLTGIPMVHTEHSSKLNKPLESISSLDKKLAKKAFAAASVITAVSTAYADRLCQNFGIHAQVVPNVLALASPRRSLSLSKGLTNFTWISVGRLIASKGMSTLLDAFANTLQQCPNQQLWIIGDGPQKVVLQNQIQQLHLTDKVKLLGAMPRNKVQECLANAHAFVLLSESETFGVSYIEALAMGLPVVATACGGPSDFVNDSNGLMVPIGDAAMASVAMQNIANQYAIYNREQLSKDIVHKYQPSAVAKQLKEMYTTVCGKISL